jgi:hypothetical protein
MITSLISNQVKIKKFHQSVFWLNCMYLIKSVEIVNSKLEIESHFDIDEKTYDSDVDYKGIPKPFLAYAPNGTVLSVIICLKILIKYSK